MGTDHEISFSALLERVAKYRDVIGFCPQPPDMLARYPYQACMKLLDIFIQQTYARRFAAANGPNSVINEMNDRTGMNAG
ncbi:hypothetical protein GCM10010872_08330 [Dyella flava]|nr:hypothetical protein GCM10010872_08330 [Dyella flava]